MMSLVQRSSLVVSCVRKERLRDHLNGCLVIFREPFKVTWLFPRKAEVVFRGIHASRRYDLVWSTSSGDLISPCLGVCCVRPLLGWVTESVADPVNSGGHDIVVINAEVQLKK
jgi:hypothetical protein